MKIIIIGYKDANALDEGSVIAGPGIADEIKAEEIIAAARDRHVFPNGFKRIECFELGSPIVQLAFISDDVAKTIQGHNQKALLATAEQQKSRDRERDKQKSIASAQKVFHASLRKRNEAIAAVASQKNLLASDTISENDKNAVLKKVADLQPKADAASKEFDVILSAFNIIKNPKSSPAEFDSALMDLKIKDAQPISA